MPHANRAKAEREARQLLATLGIDTIPVPVDDVIRSLGAGIVLQAMDSEVSGMTYRHDGHSVVGINSTHHRLRRRFTAAHETGHLALHPGRPLTVDSNIRVNFRDAVSSQASDNEEIEANTFAATLLMPADKVLSCTRQLQDSGVRTRERLVKELAKQFDVSNDAMGYRLVNLGVTSST